MIKSTPAKLFKVLIKLEENMRMRPTRIMKTTARTCIWCQGRSRSTLQLTTKVSNSC